MKKKYLFNRAVGYLCNIVVILLPIMAWDIIVLFVLAGILPEGMLDFVNPFVKLLLIVSMLITNPLIALLYGQTFGAVSFNVEVVDIKKNKTNHMQNMMREFLGVGLPIFLLYWLSGYIGVLIYIVLNIVVVLVDPYGRTLIDFVTHTYVRGVDRGSKALKKTKKVEEVKPVIEKEAARQDLYAVDLHTHSRYSVDGELSVEEVFAKAIRNGIKVLSITDTNCVKANMEAEVLAQHYEIKYIPGIEIDCQFDGHDVQLLGYGINYKDERFLQLENVHLKKERKASIDRITKFETATGLQVDAEALVTSNANGIIDGRMICNQVLNNPAYSHEEVLKRYRNAQLSFEDNLNSMVKDYFDEGHLAYVKVDRPSLMDMATLIAEAGGVAIIAHPIKSFGKDAALLNSALQQGPRGIQVFEPLHNEEDIAYLLSIVKETACLVTCGSGFMKRNDGIEIAQSGAKERFTKLIDVFVNKF